MKVPEICKKRLYIKHDMTYWNSRKGKENLTKLNKQGTGVADNVHLPGTGSDVDSTTLSLSVALCMLNWKGYHCYSK